MNTMNKKINKTMTDMTTGTLLDKIVLFALPLAITSILQQLFNAADLAVVGRFSSPQAIYKWQYGQSLPSVDNLLALSVILGVSIEKILVVENDCGDLNFRFNASLLYAC